MFGKTNADDADADSRTNEAWGGEGGRFAMSQLADDKCKRFPASERSKTWRLGGGSLCATKIKRKILRRKSSCSLGLLPCVKQRHWQPAVYSPSNLWSGFTRSWKTEAELSSLAFFYLLLFIISLILIYLHCFDVSYEASAVREGPNYSSIVAWGLFWVLHQRYLHS